MAFKLDNAALTGYCAAHGVQIADNGKLRLFGVRGGIPYAASEVSLQGNALDGWNDDIGIWGTDWAQYKGTVDPGLKYTQTPMNPHGAGILQSLEDCHKPWRFVWGMHKGQYKCLVQGEPFTVFRDKNKDGVTGENDSVETGWFAIQLHHGADTATVGAWSAACSVIRDPGEFADFISRLEASGQTEFEYYLIEGQALAFHLGLNAR